MQDVRQLRLLREVLLRPARRRPQAQLLPHGRAGRGGRVRRPARADPQPAEERRLRRLGGAKGRPLGVLLPPPGWQWWRRAGGCRPRPGRGVGRLRQVHGGQLEGELGIQGGNSMCSYPGILISPPTKNCGFIIIRIQGVIFSAPSSICK